MSKPASSSCIIILANTSCLGEAMTKAKAPGFRTRKHSFQILLSGSALSQSLPMNEIPSIGRICTNKVYTVICQSAQNLQTISIYYLNHLFSPCSYTFLLPIPMSLWFSQAGRRHGFDSSLPGFFFSAPAKKDSRLLFIACTTIR